MLAVRALYTGKTVKLLERVPVHGKTAAIVTFLDGSFDERKTRGSALTASYRSAVQRLRGAYRSSLHSSAQFCRSKKTEKKLDL